MKKLEKMDGKLFESLKPNEMSNLAAFVGGKNETTLPNAPVDQRDTCFTSSIQNGSSPEQCSADFTSYCDDSCTKDKDGKFVIENLENFEIVMLHEAGIVF